MGVLWILVLFLLHQSKAEDMIHKDNPSQSTEASQNQTSCERAKNVIFIKLPKTGSSTIRSLIAENFAVNDNLTVIATGREKFRRFPYTTPFRSCMYKSTPWSVYRRQSNVFARHAILDTKEVDGMVGPGAKRFTVLRDPVTLFGGLVDQASKCWYSWPQTCTFHTYVEQKGEGCFLGLSELGFTFINTQARLLSVDLGIKPHEEERLEEAIKKLDDYFDVILIFERFAESMILMKDLLCLSWNELARAGFRRNARSEEQKRKYALSEYQKQRVREMCYLDAALHKYFTKKFDERVKAYGTERMARDLVTFHEKYKEWNDHCSSSQVSKKDLENLCLYWKDGVYLPGRDDWYTQYLNDRLATSYERLSTRSASIFQLSLVWIFTFSFLVVGKNRAE